MPNLLETHGAHSSKDPKYVPIFVERSFTGLFTQRAALHDPSDLQTKFYAGGRPDALWMGSNIELSNNLTLKRRPGLSPFSTVTYPTAPDRAYSFELINGTIQVVIDCGSTGNLNIGSVASSSGGTAVYTGTFPNAGSNAYAGLIFNITGFSNPANNGVFTCTASTTTTLTLNNAIAVAEVTIEENAFAGTAADIGGGHGAWTNPSFAQGPQDGQFASVVLFIPKFSTNYYTNTLACTNYGFTVNNANTITGVVLNLVGFYTLEPINLYATLVNAGVPLGTVKFSLLPSSDGILSFGSAMDSWGASLTPAIVNSPTFGVRLSVGGTTGSFTNNTIQYIDAAQLVVYSTGVGAGGGNAVSTGAVYVDNQNGTKTLLFGKAVGAGQTYFSAVAGILYMGDGVDTRKYTPGNVNGVVWNWGITAPASQPSVTIIPSGSAAILWTANTVWSTMGLAYDAVSGSIQQMISVNASGTNTTQLGTTGNGGPQWNQTPGGTTVEGSGSPITWTNRGPIGLWKANTFYANPLGGPTVAAPCIIWDPVTKACYIVGNPGTGGGTSGGAYPNFPPGPGQSVQDGGVKWFYIGTPGEPSVWQPTTAYPLLGSVTNNDAVSSVVEPVGLGTVGPPSNVSVWWQTSGGGTSGTGDAPPPYSVVPGVQTFDGDLIWMSLGTYTWAALTNYSAWTVNGSPFSALVDSNGNFQVCTVTGQSGTIQPTWATAYGKTTTDGSAVWTCVGDATAWAASKQWFLPTVGFSPPSSSSPFGGAAVKDSNGNIEFVVNSGLGGASPPSWGGIGTYTTDNLATWYNLEVAPAHSLAWQSGYVYAYSFKARTLTDFYSVPAAGTSTPPVPPGLSNPLPAPTGSETGVISTASPVFTIVGSDTGAINTIQGLGSTDPQVDTIVIWRSADGGGSSNMFELTEIPAPPAIGGIAQPWTFKDYLPDTPTAQFPGLNELISAPIDDSNDPPPSTFLPMVYNFQRIWGGNGQSVIFSGGPDVPTGNPNEAFNPVDSLPFLSIVVSLVKNTQGLVTFLTDSIQLIAGGPATASFFSVELCPNVGLLSYNALDVHAGEIYFFSADNQFYALSPSLNLSRAGFPVGDQLANEPSSGVSDTTWNPKNVYVAVHQNGIDNCIMLADGSTGWYRLNPYQVPGGVQGPEPIWSPYATITNGCQMVQSVQTAPGVKRLLIGATTGGQQILYRDLNNFTDNGTMYDANFTMGSIVLVSPGQLAVLKFLEMDFSGQSFQPIISYLLNDISGTFTPFTKAPQFDPPSLYGTTIVPQSYSPLRYYFSSTGSLARCKNMQIRIDFGQTSNGDELYNFTIFGRLLAEF